MSVKRSRVRGNLGEENEETKRAIVSILRRGNTRRCACGTMNITGKMLYDWCRNDPDFYPRIANAEAEYEQEMMLIIQSAARGVELPLSTDQKTPRRKLSFAAASFWLERRRPRDYAGDVAARDVTAHMAKLARRYELMRELLAEKGITFEESELIDDDEDCYSG